LLLRYSFTSINCTLENGLTVRNILSFYNKFFFHFCGRYLVTLLISWSRFYNIGHTSIHTLMTNNDKHTNTCTKKVWSPLRLAQYSSVFVHILFWCFLTLIKSVDWCRVRRKGVLHGAGRQRSIPREDSLHSDSYQLRSSVDHADHLGQPRRYLRRRHQFRRYVSV
jgi:hypothetical protein